MAYNYLLSDTRDNGICILTISAPKTLNALNSAVLKELDTFIGSLDSAVKVLIITGDGPKSFVAGADISQMSTLSAKEALEFSKSGAGVFRKIEILNIPVIAAINGYALGGGCELALSCDIRIASDNAVFGQPEVKLGIIPGFSGTYRLSKIVGQGFAKEIIYSGKNIRSDEALRIGLVNHVVSIDELMPTVLALAETIVANAPIALKNAKKSINEGFDLDSEGAIALESKLFSDCFNTADQKNGMAAFLEKRKAVFENK